MKESRLPPKPPSASTSIERKDLNSSKNLTAISKRRNLVRMNLLQDVMLEKRPSQRQVLIKVIDINSSGDTLLKYKLKRDSIITN